MWPPRWPMRLQHVGSTWPHAVCSMWIPRGHTLSAACGFHMATRCLQHVNSTWPHAVCSMWVPRGLTLSVACDFHVGPRCLWVPHGHTLPATCGSHMATDCLQHVDSTWLHIVFSMWVPRGPTLSAAYDFHAGHGYRQHVDPRGANAMNVCRQFTSCTAVCQLAAEGRDSEID